MKNDDGLTCRSIETTNEYMRTTLDIPEELIEEARSMLGFKSKTDTVIVALRELVRRRRLDEIKRLYGRLDVTVNLPRSRRRQRKDRQ
jgi:Arc/MetJ family transcription regulator